MLTVTLDLPSRTSWGEWGTVQYCPWGSYAKRVSIKVESYRRSGDDTAVNGVRLDCFRKDGKTSIARITSKVHVHGSWQPNHQCRNGFIKGSRLRNYYETTNGRLLYGQRSFACSLVRPFSACPIGGPQNRFLGSGLEGADDLYFQT